MLNALLFIATYAAGFYASFTRNPAYAFVLYEAVYFFYPAGRSWGYMIPSISYSFTVVALMALVMALNYQQAKQNKLLHCPQFRWMYILLIIYLCTYFIAVYPESHERFSIYFLKMVIIMSIAYKLIDSREKLTYVIYGYLFGAWYIGFAAFQVGRNSGDRVEGIGTSAAPDANDIAAAIAPALVLSLYYFWASKKLWVKGLVVVAGVFIANGLVLINSRGAFLGAIAGLTYLMFYMAFSSFKKKNQKLMVAFITIAGLAGTAVIIDPTSIERFHSISQESAKSEEEANASTRLFYWVAAWDMAKDHPFGSGHMGFNYHATHYLPEDLDTGTAFRDVSVHSSWFEALSETGYPGLLAFILMLYSAFHTLTLCRKELRRTNQVDEYYKIIAIQGALIAFIVAMTFINRMRAEVLYWLILYSACAYNIYILKAQSKKAEAETSTKRDRKK